MSARAMQCQGSTLGHGCRWGFENSTDVCGGRCRAGSHAWRTVVCRVWTGSVLSQGTPPSASALCSADCCCPAPSGSPAELFLSLSLKASCSAHALSMCCLPPSPTRVCEGLIFCERLVLRVLPVTPPVVAQRSTQMQRNAFRTYTVTLAVS